MENEPLFRKGDLLMWDPEFQNKESAGYRDHWGLGPFVCDRDIFGEEDTVRPVEIQKLNTNGWATVAWAKRFKKAVFLNAIKEALAEHDNGGASQ